MRALILLVTAAALCCTPTECQRPIPTAICLPQPVVQVPIQVQVRRAGKLDLCDLESGTSTATFSQFLLEEIVASFKSPTPVAKCRVQDLVETSCIAVGLRRQRVNVAYTANLTCSDGCQRYPGQQRDAQGAQKFFNGQVSTLRVAMRSKFSTKVKYEGRPVNIHYLSGSKGHVIEACQASYQGSIRDKMPLCECPQSCLDVCTLKPETGLCRAVIPRYFHNATSKQCELFTYGGCGGNQNNFVTQEDCATNCKVCPSGKVFQDCGTACPDTCDNKDEVRPCTLQCVQGCFCPSGMVEHGDECVTPEQCPTGATEEPTEPECPEGKVYQDCGTSCPKTCDNKDELTLCIFQCVEGCFCPSGMVEHGDECVTPEQCPTGATEEPTEPECPEGKVYQDCGTSCPKTCDNKDELTFCTLQCVQGCFCPFGMVEHGDECVTPENCPTGATDEPTEPECPEGKVYQDCGTSCPKTCDNKDESSFCTLQCVQDCFCPSGMVEHGDECVTPEQCPTGATEEPTEPECPEGKVYQDCGTSCPKTCDNKNESSFCITQCVQGCFCPSGMVEHGDECVTPKQCPTGATEEPTEPECPEGKVYRDCGTACPKTCGNKDELTFCTLQCVQGCFCPFGMVEHGDECVTPENCPTGATEEPTEPQCPEGKVYQDCGTSCPKTCDNKDESSFCTLQCVQGCFCAFGMVEHGDECVTPEQCPTEATEEPTEPECPEGKVYQDCGTSCPKTCDNKNESSFCITLCVQGCFCPSGMVEHGDECVTPEKCPTEATEEPTEPECPEGKVYRDCGTACPKTCDNKDELTFCTLQCVQGCFCPSDTVELEDSCVPPSKCPDLCTLPPVTGICEAFIPSFFYNSTSRQCDMFVYGGCGGNGNRFESVKECKKACAPVDKCTLKPLAGACRARIPRYFYNSSSEQCETFNYGGCGGNDNRFESVKDCKKACDPDDCSSEPLTGPCKAFFTRFFFNTTSKQCEQFIYGGCQGNDNRYETEELCLETCGEDEDEDEHEDDSISKEKPTKPEPQCPEGKVYQDCGSSCPRTCDNKDELTICTDQCVQGCFCPEGEVLSGETCVDPNKCK